jgi:hypothetical protein
MKGCARWGTAVSIAKIRPENEAKRDRQSKPEESRLDSGHAVRQEATYLQFLY